MIHESPFPDAEIPDVPLTTFVFASAGERAGKAAFIDGPSGRDVTYGELLDQIQRRRGA